MISFRDFNYATKAVMTRNVYYVIFYIFLDLIDMFGGLFKKGKIFKIELIYYSFKA